MNSQAFADTFVADDLVDRTSEERRIPVDAGGEVAHRNAAEELCVGSHQSPSNPIVIAYYNHQRAGGVEGWLSWNRTTRTAQTLPDGSIPRE